MGENNTPTAHKGCGVKSGKLVFYNPRLLIQVLEKLPEVLTALALPDKFLVVETELGFSASDIDSAFEHIQIHCALYSLLTLCYTATHKLTLRAVPESCK